MADSISAERLHSRVRAIVLSGREVAKQAIKEEMRNADHKMNSLRIIEGISNGQTLTGFVKNPHVSHFLGYSKLPRANINLKQALLDRLKQFLLERDSGFCFVGQNQTVTLDGEHFYIDLVFYNRLTRCFVLIDLKTGKLTHQDLGQMQMYVHYYQREMMVEGENPPIGIVLCADKSEAVVRYTLPENNQQIFASRYRLHLPTEEELAREIQRECQIIEREQRVEAGVKTRP